MKNYCCYNGLPRQERKVVGKNEGGSIPLCGRCRRHKALPVSSFIDSVILPHLFNFFRQDNANNFARFPHTFQVSLYDDHYVFLLEALGGSEDKKGLHENLIRGYSTNIRATVAPTERDKRAFSSDINCYSNIVLGQTSDFLEVRAF